MRYDPKAIEVKWQKRWLREKIYEPDFLRAKRPFYNLMMFPYPSAEGLHVGNVYAFTGADIFGRYQRMRRFDVFEPIGLDGFGIHSENYALKIGKHPAEQAKISEKRFYSQLQAIGNGFAWEERLETYDPAYYKWTQWIFTEMFRRGLAYRKKSPVNWCPSCKTVLADEQVINVSCERCGTKVIKRDLEQWFFRITQYAKRLLKNLEKIDWSERIKVAQRNWIGRSDGALIKFQIPNPKSQIEVFTTRPDTLFGATYMVLAPEHPLIEKLESKVENLEAVRRYIRRARAKKDDERIAEGKTKTGVELKGIRAVNPANGKTIPVWVADYVLGHVGTGAIMAVPAHDQRDYEFVKKYKLPVRWVIDPVTGIPQENASPKRKIVAFVEDGNRVLTINWGPRLGGRLLIGGTVEGREDPVRTAVREIREETGYSDVALVERGEETVHHRYFAHSKQRAFYAYTTPLHFKLKSKARVSPKLEHDERDKFSVEWVPKAVADREIMDPLHRYVFEKFVFLRAFTGAGAMKNSGRFDGMDSEKAKWAITKAVGGKRTATYRLRDWLISRQRYWGPPIPMIYCATCAAARHGERRDMPGWYAVPEKDLPVRLPYIRNFRPTGTDKSPLATVEKFWKVRCPRCRSWARRETDVSDTFLDSAWYYLRYPSVRDARNPWNPVVTRRWFPVDMYIGGAEHAVLHLLYVRFLAMVFYDWKLLPAEEPFERFRAHGLLISGGAKMSKSRGNVVNPDEYVRACGADALRMYLMFLGPFEQGGDFRGTGIRGMTRFLERVWKFVHARGDAGFGSGSGLDAPVHRTVTKVTADIEGLQYNTAISALMVLLNAFEAEPDAVGREHLSVFLRLLAPFAPHLTEELWHSVLGERASIHRSRWPEADPRFFRRERATVVIQVNGRVRDRIEVEAGMSEVTVRELVLARPKVREWLGGKPVRKFIYVPRRIANIVT